MNEATRAVLERLRSPETIRTRAHALLSLARQGKLEHLCFAESRLEPTVDFVTAVVLERYPDLNIPPHTRLRHFEMGGVERLGILSGSDTPGESLTELVVLSVLLDAGAGSGWQYLEAETGAQFSRSEGLALASLALLKSGVLSADAGNPFRVDASKLVALDVPTLSEYFQVRADNPLTGVEGRAALLNRLGKHILDTAACFGDSERLGGLFGVLTQAMDPQGLGMGVLFRVLLDALAPIWPVRQEFAGVPLGDVWIHSALATEEPGSAFVPFHKLTQWLACSMAEVVALQGIRVYDTELLTGLAEYRNGGLFLDTGLLVLRDPDAAGRLHHPSDELVVEWRALTVALLDIVADGVRRKLGKSGAGLPLTAILQGGTWEAGRRIARQKREHGTPPLQVVSDGTLF